MLDVATGCKAIRRYNPQYRSPPRRGYGGGGRSPPRRGYGGRREQGSGSLLVRNIPLSCRPEDLRVPFERFGPVRDVYLPKDYYTRGYSGEPERRNSRYGDKNMEPGEMSDPLNDASNKEKVIPKGIIRHPLRPKLSMTFVEEPNTYVGDSISDTLPPDRRSRCHLLHLIELARAPAVASCQVHATADRKPDVEPPRTR
ncbi:pre-mRNA splicing factor [Hordeum vulgare]|nr:pre-mRNA splicing factor [Hordeum vulgare]